MPYGQKVSDKVRRARDLEAMQKEHGVDNAVCTTSHLRLGMPVYSVDLCNCKQEDSLCDFCYNKLRWKAYQSAGRTRASPILSALQRSSIRYLSGDDDVATTDYYTTNVYPLMMRAMLSGAAALLVEGCIPFVLGVTEAGSLIAMVLPPGTVHITWPMNHVAGDAVPHVAMVPIRPMDGTNFSRLLTQAELAGTPVRADLGLTIYSADVTVIGDRQPNAGLNNARASAPGVWVYRPADAIVNAENRELLLSPVDSYLDEYLSYLEAVRLDAINERSAVRGELIVERETKDRKDLLANAVERLQEDSEYTHSVNSVLEQQAMHRRGEGVPTDATMAGSAAPFSTGSSDANNNATLRDLVARETANSDAAQVTGETRVFGARSNSEAEDETNRIKQRRLEAAAMDRELIVMSSGERVSSSRVKASERRGAVDVAGKLERMNAAIAMAHNLPLLSEAHTVRAGVRLAMDRTSHAIHNISTEVQAFLQVIIDIIHPHSAAAVSEQVATLRSAVTDEFLLEVSNLMFGAGTAHCFAEDDSQCTEYEAASRATQDMDEAMGPVPSSRSSKSDTVGLSLAHTKCVDKIGKIIHRLRCAHSRPIGPRSMFKPYDNISDNYFVAFSQVHDSYDTLTRNAWSNWASTSSCDACLTCDACTDMRRTIHETASASAKEVNDFAERTIWPADIRVKIDTHTTMELDSLIGAYDASIMSTREMIANQRSALLLPPLDYSSPEAKKLVAEAEHQRRLRTDTARAQPVAAGGEAPRKGRAEDRESDNKKGKKKERGRTDEDQAEGDDGGGEVKSSRKGGDGDLRGAGKKRPKGDDSGSAKRTRR